MSRENLWEETWWLEDDRVSGLDGTVRSDVHYTVHTHQGRSHRYLLTNPAVSLQIWINLVGMWGTTPCGAGLLRGKPYTGQWPRHVLQDHLWKSPESSQMSTHCWKQGLMMVVDKEEWSIDYTCCLAIFQGLINPTLFCEWFKKSWYTH